MRSIMALVARRWTVVLSALCLSGTTVAQMPAGPAGGTPCLQKLEDQRIRDEARPKKKSGGGILGTIVGAGGGFGIGQLVCRGRTGDARVRCLAATTVGGGVLGNALGRRLDAQAQKKVVEASYASALSGQPTALSLGTGCAVVETTQPLHFEARDVDLAMEEGIARPAGILHAIGEPQRVARPAPIEASAARSRKALRQLPADTSAFVMGSVDQGRWLLIGRGSEDAGYVASGYAPAAGWSRDPDRAVAPAQAGTARNVPVRAELPCWTSKLTVRDGDAKAEQHTVDTPMCRGPDGLLTQPTQAPVA